MKKTRRARRRHGRYVDSNHSLAARPARGSRPRFNGKPPSSEDVPTSLPTWPRKRPRPPRAADVFGPSHHGAIDRMQELQHSLSRYLLRVNGWSSVGRFPLIPNGGPSLCAPLVRESWPSRGSLLTRIPDRRRRAGRRDSARPVKVMTRNLYLGANLNGPVRAALSAPTPASAGRLWQRQRRRCGTRSRRRTSRRARAARRRDRRGQPRPDRPAGGRAVAKRAGRAAEPATARSGTSRSRTRPTSTTTSWDPADRARGAR